MVSVIHPSFIHLFIKPCKTSLCEKIVLHQVNCWSEVAPVKETGSNLDQ